MKAYVIEQAGGPDMLHLKDIPSLAPKADEVRIRVKAFGLNRAEVYLRAGKMGPIEGLRVPGIEAVGEVLEDASGTFRKGQKVATAMGGMQFTRTGSYAEEVTVARSNVVDLEGIALSWEALGALPQAFLTVWGALDKNLAIQKGQTLLVRGASSSVGMAAVIYARYRGLNVVATTRTEKHRGTLTMLGAEVVIDDGQIAPQLLQSYPAGIDAALEIVGGATLMDTLKAVRPFGAVTCIGLLSGPPVLNNVNLMTDIPPAVKLSFFPSQLLGSAAMPLQESPLREIAQAMAENKIPVLPGRLMTFDEVREAHKLMEANGAEGKIVVRMDA